MNVAPKKILVIMVGFSCNNNCIMCSTRPKARNNPDRTTEEIVGDLAKGRKKYSLVEFTGGEPTVRPDILYLIKTAQELGYKEIGLSTNARLLSYNDFLKKAVKNGLNRVTFSLYGHTPKLHEAITRTPHSFEQTIKGVKNVLKYPQIAINANTVVFRLNFRYLSQIGKFIRRLGIKYWNLLDLIPDGYAKDLYRMLYPRITELSKNLNSLESILKDFCKVGFFDFPLCLFSKKMRQNPQATFVTCQRRKEFTKQIGYQPKRLSVKSGVYEDIHKSRTPICKSCIFFKTCGGVWKDYLNLYGGKEIIKLAKKHRCLKT